MPPVVAPKSNALRRFLENLHPSFKILYLLTLSIAVLIFEDQRFNLAMLGFQVLLWVAMGVRKKDIRTLRKAYPFALAILIINTLFGVDRTFALISGSGWTLWASPSGFIDALHFAGRFFTLMLTSIVVRSCTSSENFVTGLIHLKLSRNFALVLDNLLGSLEGINDVSDNGHVHGSGQGKLKRRNKNKSYTLKGILKGDFQFLTIAINKRLKEAHEKFPDLDWAMISAVSVMMVGIRMVQFMPGLPIAPGHKNIILVPLFILVARYTRKPFAATSVGLLSGIINFMFGYGKYGILGILQFMVPGLMVDLFGRLFPKKPGLIYLAILGLLTGLARVSAEIALAQIFDLPKAFYVVLLPLIISQAAFGAFSAPITLYLLKHIQKPEIDPNINPIEKLEK